MYIDKPLRKYLDDLAARLPAPGGGSAAALGASVGASLMLMVANYTVGNPKYRESEPRISGILKKTGSFKAELEKLIDEDVEAYDKLSKAIASCGKDPAKLDASYKDAVMPPLKICEIAYACLGLCKDLAECGNKNLVTDTAIAAIMLEGAFFSAKFNVYINLKYIKDADYIAKIHETLAPLEETIHRLKEEIIEKCEDVIAK